MRTCDTVMFGPAGFVFVRSKSKLKSVRHCVVRMVRSARVPGRNMLVSVS